MYRHTTINFRLQVKHDDKTEVEHCHPAETLREKATSWNSDVTSQEFAKKMDAEDPLRHLRDQFHYPKSIDLPQGEPKTSNATWIFEFRTDQFDTAQLQTLQIS